jgi:SAM-dependent methyltransferase
MRERFAVRRLPDGRALVNLGSSARVAPGWNNVDFSWLLRLARRPRLARFLHGAGVVSDFRYERLRRLDPGAVCWDLRRGVPFGDETFDVVYHSHVLEHLEREDAPGFLRECFRVLKRGGVLRVVVPDLEQLARRYADVVERLPARASRDEHATAVDDILDQLVRVTPKARADRPAAVRALVSVLVGDTRRSGEKHRWMYDRFSLGWLLEETGFTDVAACEAGTSRIEGWNAFGLDVEPDGSPYKPHSAYLEARRPKA